MPVWSRRVSPEAFLPLVLLLVMVAPLMLDRARWGLVSDTSACWGRLGLNVLGGDLWVTQAPGPAPPVFAWSMALALAIPGVSPSWLAILPGYLYGLGCLWLLYRLGRQWFGVGTAVLSCFFVGLSPFFLEQMLHAGSPTCVLFWTLLAFRLYTRHLYARDDIFSPRVGWAGLVFGILLLTCGIQAIWVPLVALLDLLYGRLHHRVSFSSSLRVALEANTSLAGLIVIALGLVLASPWLAFATGTGGPVWPWQTPPGTPVPSASPTLLLMRESPALFVLGLFGIGAALRTCLMADGTPEEGDPRARPLPDFPLLWSLVAWFGCETTHATASMLLLAFVPLVFFAAQSLLLITERRLPDAVSVAMILATGLVFGIASMPAVLDTPRLLWDWLVTGTPPPAGPLLAAHVGFDALLLFSLLVLAGYRLTRTHEDGRRWLLGGFVVLVIFLAGWPEVRPPEDASPLARRWDEFLATLREYDDVGQVVVLGELAEPLRFTIQARYRDAEWAEVSNRYGVEQRLAHGEGRPLILLTDSREPLLRVTSVPRNGQTIALTMIHDSPLLVAYTTAADPTD